MEKLNNAPAIPGVSPSIKPVGFAEVSDIPLHTVKYGKAINDRLKTINDNFAEIITRDYLRGNDGVGLDIREWKSNRIVDDYRKGFDLTDNDIILKQIVDAICQLDGGTTNELCKLITTGICNQPIYLIYKGDELISSLPFTFIDPRFANIESVGIDKDFENIRDLSCIFHYDNGKFKAVQSFPTIYYDSSIGGGELCWLINGLKTGLPCRGPKGQNGVSGKIYTVLCESPKNDINKLSILGAFVVSGVSDTDAKNKFIPTEDFGKTGISIENGCSVIAIFGSYEDDPENTGEFIVHIDSSVGESYVITNASVTDDGTMKNYFIIYDKMAVKIPHRLDESEIERFTRDYSFVFDKLLEARGGAIFNVATVDEQLTAQVVESEITNASVLNVHNTATLNKATVTNHLNTKSLQSASAKITNGLESKSVKSETLEVTGNANFSGFKIVPESIITEKPIKVQEITGPLKIDGDITIDNENFVMGNLIKPNRSSFPSKINANVIPSGEIGFLLSETEVYTGRILYPRALMGSKEVCVVSLNNGGTIEYYAIEPKDFALFLGYFGTDDFIDISNWANIYSLTPENIENSTLGNLIESDMPFDRITTGDGRAVHEVKYKENFGGVPHWEFNGEVYTSNIGFAFGDENFVILKSLHKKTQSKELNYANGYSTDGYKYIFVKRVGETLSSTNSDKTWVEGTKYDYITMCVTSDSDKHFNETGHFVFDVSGESSNNYMKNVGYFCESFSLNEVDLISKLHEMENHIMNLENRIKELENK